MSPDIDQNSLQRVPSKTNQVQGIEEYPRKKEQDVENTYGDHADKISKFLHLDLAAQTLNLWLLARNINTITHFSRFTT